MRPLPFLSAVFLTVATPVLAQVTVDLHALEGLPGQSPASRPVRVRHHAVRPLQRGKAPTVSLEKASEWMAGFNPAEHNGSLPRTIKDAGGAIWSPYFGDVTPALISESHSLGIPVVVWTVNKPADIARMIDMGVDGVISDHPDILRQIAGDKGIALPAGSPVTP